ncbi:MAG: MotA/TolQ/ExbB proton channel family protein [Gammaproteobacteria bacterium]|nr:MotA/TolQ/ExbB proton channel family protein [Gammaproteobacteria bacterium]
MALKLRRAPLTAVAIAVLFCANAVSAQTPAAPAAPGTAPAAAAPAPAAPGAVPGETPTGAVPTDPMAAGAEGAMPTDTGMTGAMGTGTEGMGEAATGSMPPESMNEPVDAGAADEPAPETAVVENPYGLGALWKQGDFVSRFTLIILLIMSVFTWYIAFIKLLYQQMVFNQAKAAGAKFWTSSSLQEGAKELKKNNVFRMLVEDGLQSTKHHDGKLTDQIDLHEWVTMSLQRSVDTVNSKLQTGLAFLATVGSTAPFVGLFGTVWGIYHALIAIGVAGQASIDKVAGPVGEALIMTAVGLAVAVPAVLFYNWLVRRNKVASERLRNFAADIHQVLLSGARVSGGAVTAQAAARVR